MIKYNALLTKEPTRKWLDDNNWKYSKAMSDADEKYYTKRFPVYKYNLSIILDCEMILNVATKDLYIGVYDSTSRALYAPWYYVEYGNYNEILSIINKNIEKEMKRLGIVYVNDNHRNRL